MSPFKGAASGAERPQVNELLPMIQVPNPNPGEDGDLTMYVYRPWTVEDVKKATEGIHHPKVKVATYIEGVEGLYASYRLNGVEIERAIRQIMGHDWCLICGNWNPNDDQGSPLPYGDANLRQRLTDLEGRVRGRYQARANWTEINRCIQKDDEDVDHYYHRLKEVFDNHSGVEVPQDMANVTPYEQQLKNAFLKGSQPQISSFVSKHMVDHRTARLQNTLEYARHAEQHFKDKRKAKKGNELILEEDGATILVLNSGRGGYKGRGRGRGRGRGHDTGCWECGQEGHWAQDCPKKRTPSYQTYQDIRQERA
ncbi:hypothetical protein F2P81_000044 [Scophthalmus maximus]|uniref:CCHC-type domain-containing protein n=1 Tax=Scophthalmus maximus TaxID=52904 RepID=A0A6A4TUR0_SCOMX|nr:hypothetical protein F2P81_000044 [Scophthalmus maximus]